jgi:hypothetical protein
MGGWGRLFKYAKTSGNMGSRAINGLARPGSCFEYAARLTEIYLLGVLGQRFGGLIEWDAKNMRVRIAGRITSVFCFRVAGVEP